MTPQFYETAKRRLETDLDGAYRYAERHFGGEHRYLKELSKNIRFVEDLTREGDACALKRNPPVTLGEPDEKPWKY